MKENFYKKLGVKKQTAQAGDLIKAMNEKKMSQHKVIASSKIPLKSPMGRKIASLI